MKATEVLKEEHQVILRVVASLERGVELLEHGTAVRPGFFADAARFIKGVRRWLSSQERGRRAFH